ncbi:hypothetical protein GCM10011591_43790 [Nocardia camponoti]|uniref:Uncharacterized protein n=1 Tax=Nocardia camponoti TaxID=1616106 RepID=A0A917QTW1_9NOCA|nr:hypothetical protein GCM10011591_43790 [Nocardia camponoti]
MGSFELGLTSANPTNTAYPRKTKAKTVPTAAPISLTAIERAVQHATTKTTASADATTSNAAEAQL